MLTIYIYLFIIKNFYICYDKRYNYLLIVLYFVSFCTFILIYGFVSEVSFIIDLYCKFLLSNTLILPLILLDDATNTIIIIFIIFLKSFFTIDNNILT